MNEMCACRLGCSSTSSGQVFSRGLRAWLATSIATVSIPLVGLAQAPPPDAAPQRAPSQPALKNSQGMTLVEIPGIPVYVAAWETRVRDFKQFVEDSGYDWKSTPFFPQTDDHPAVNISLRDALAYCNWLTKREQASGAISALQSYRLPTKKEWDAAVGMVGAREKVSTAQERETDQITFPWGMEWPPPARAGNFNSLEISGMDDGYLHTAPVGTFAASPEGLFDLAGNVWEWNWEQTAAADSGLQIAGVLRGGSWMYFRKECLLSSYLYKVPADTRAPSIGFRYVMEDKRRTAAFLAVQEKEDSESARKRREALAAGPKATPQQIEELRKQMQRKPSTGQAEALDRAPLPDPATLKPAGAGVAFTNTLGMHFLPLGEGEKLLFGEHEVRVQDFQAGAEAIGRPWTGKPTFAIGETHPVVNVSWQDAVKFCEWLTQKDQAAKLIPAGARYRLPTDVEWSRAAGLPAETGDTPAARHLANKSDYPWGREPLPPMLSANLDTARMTGYQDSFSYTSPVGSFSPNSVRLYDLAGNVSEWCEDPWPDAASERVVRGSSWLMYAPDTLLTSARQHLASDATRADVGFRVVLELP